MMNITVFSSVLALLPLLAFLFLLFKFSLWLPVLSLSLLVSVTYPSLLFFPFWSIFFVLSLCGFFVLLFSGSPVFASFPLLSLCIMPSSLSLAFSSSGVFGVLSLCSGERAGKLESPKLKFWWKASNLSGLFSRFFLFQSSLGFSPVFPPVSPLCHGLSLAFIKPENAMRSCLCHGRHRGAACRRLLICCHSPSSWTARCEWKGWYWV